MKKIKQKFFDLLLLKRSWDIFSVIATIISLILAFTGSIEDSNKWLIGIIISISFVIIFSVIYICEYVYNKFFLRRINAKIGNSNYNIYNYGDSSHISLNISGNRFNGYDYDTSSHFSGSVKNKSVTVYDYEKSSYFNYNI